MITAERPAVTSGTRHFLSLGELGSGELRSLLDLTARVKRDPDGFRGRLPGRRVGMLLDRPSTRTRVSFESAAWTLGMLPVVLHPDELQLGRGESIADTARALSLYLDALAVRTSDHSRLERFAEAATIPVINALTDDHDPCQALTDIFTIEEEFATFGGIQAAFIGDGGNVCHSLIEASAAVGLELRVATPRFYEPSPTIVNAARPVAATTGGAIYLTNDPDEAVSGAEVVYANVWTSMGRERERAARDLAFRGFIVDERLMGLASASAIFLHCLPARRGQEVTEGVIDGPASRVWRQAANRLYADTALLYALVTGDMTGERL
jgi:ornithine carbamoyltransferase